MRQLLEALITQLVDRGVRYDEARREFERRFIEQALQKTGGSIGEAAGLMGVHRNTLTRKIAEYRIKAR